jgi:hypothetical protein
METEMMNNSEYYKYSESGIKKRNFKLWEIVNKYKFGNNFKEKFYLYENKINQTPICYCGNNVKFIDMNNGFREFCSKSCMYESVDMKDKKIKTNLLKYGVDNPSKLKETKEKVKISNRKKFGVDYPLQSKKVMESLKKANIEKYGVENPQMLKDVREKAKRTMISKYGVEHPMLSDNIKNKLKETNLKRYGTENPLGNAEVKNKAMNTIMDLYGVEFPIQNLEILKKIKNTNFKKYGVEHYTQTEEYKTRMKEMTFDKNISIVNSESYNLLNSEAHEYFIECYICNNNFVIQRQLFRKRKLNSECICLVCNPIINGTSRKEKDLLEYIKNVYDGIIIENHKMVKEIDIYLPEINIGFEFNGLYWHSELNKNKLYHSDKKKFFKKQNIEIIQIWEDDWDYKSDIIKSIILNKINKSKKIYARKCIVKELDNNDIIKDFLNKNHIQGFVGSKYKIGLFYNGELVSIMTFGNLRKSLNSKSEEQKYELLRFCNKLNFTVVGGASKLFKYFIDNFKVKEVISYSDNARSDGNLYEKIGFSLQHETDINYYWAKNGIKYHRYNFRKDKLVKNGADNSKTEVEIMHDMGYYRIFDCGSKKWIFKNN